MRILFVNNRFGMLNIVDSGAANRTTLFVEALAQIGHVDVVSFYKESIKSNINNCEVLYSKCIDDNNKSFMYKVCSYVNHWVKLLIAPLEPTSYYPINNNKKKVVDKYYKQGYYDYVACRYIVDAANCDLFKYSEKLIIDVDDNPVSALKRNLSVNRSMSFVKKIQFQYELKNLDRMVSRQLEKVKVSFYSNKLEPNSPRSIYLHNATVQKKRIPDVEDNTPMRILTVGLLDYRPNRLGVEHFVNYVFPKIREKMPEVTFHVVGKTKDSSFVKWLNGHAGVKALGFVDDLLAEYRNCRVIIVPVYQGAGTSVKFVEGILMNRPVISTPMGVRGFEDLCVEGEHYLLARDDKEFADKIVGVLTSPHNFLNMAHQAYDLGINNYSKERFFEIVKCSLLN